MRDQSFRVCLFTAIAALGLSAATKPEPLWSLAQSEHFEVYSEAGPDTARRALEWFEQLRAFFSDEFGVDLERRRRARVIGFQSVDHYQPYRLRPTSDAYYVGTPGRDYIVMPSLNLGSSEVAAHEYAHLVLHASSIRLAPWLNEGLAELFSTVRMDTHGTRAGGDKPARSQVLEHREWIALSDLLTWRTDSGVERPERTDVFYAESWALTKMLASAPGYAPRFRELVAAMAPGVPGAEALSTIYSKSPFEIERDLRVWFRRHQATSFALPTVARPEYQVRLSEVPPSAVRLILAEMFLANGELGRAATFYANLAREIPDSGDVTGALATIALLEHQLLLAAKQWRKAINQGLSDADLCYRFAIFAENAGSSVEDIRSALERAVALEPDFDDARFKLALLEKSAGNYAQAVAHLRKMKPVSHARAFGYWGAMASALNELGNRDDALAAAQHAEEQAQTTDEHALAKQLAFIATTDLVVQLRKGASGKEQVITTRIPHNTPNWNPFIEPGDQIKRAEATLRDIDCHSSVTRMALLTLQGQLTLDIPDPTRVQVRNAPAEFLCGPQPMARVVVEYTATENLGRSENGVLRGIEFRK